MQVTIDSRDPLEQALGVVGALYGVELTVGAATEGAAAPQVRSTTARKRGGKRTAARQSGRRARGGAASSSKPDLAAVRSWAREQGLQVSDRGRVSNAVLEAYQQATAG